MQRISGPLLDRIDIHIRVPRVAYQELASKRRAEDSATIRGRVERARQRQLARLQPYGRFCNAQMNHTILRETCQLTGAAAALGPQHIAEAIGLRSDIGLAVE